jgi:hypothetical protein
VPALAEGGGGVLVASSEEREPPNSPISFNCRLEETINTITVSCSLYICEYCNRELDRQYLDCVRVES